MKTLIKQRIRILVTLTALFLLTSSALASSEAGYSLPWWTVDSGGGASTGGGYKLSGAFGQPDAGTTLTNSSYKLTGGFWGGTFPSPRVYLPILQFPDYYKPPCTPANRYCEDNNTPGTAFGPLSKGVTYQAYPNDQQDYYYINLTTSATVSIQVTGYSANGQLNFIGSDGYTHLCGYDSNVPPNADGKMTINCVVSPGKYYIRIFTSLGANSSTLYSLVVTY